MSVKTNRIADQLRAEIRSGRYCPQERMPSAVSLAERFSVTKETINMALSRLVSEGLVCRRKGSGTYVQAGVGGGGRPKTIGVCLNRTLPLSPAETPTSFAVHQGIVAAAEARGYDVLQLTENRLRERAFSSPGLDGLILSGGDPGLYEKIRDDLAARNLPYVLTDRFSLDDDLNYVEEYSSSTVYKATMRLWERGHRRIAGLGYAAPNLMYRNFFIGYEQALREKGVYDPALVKAAASADDATVDALVDAWFALAAPPTAIFVFWGNAFDALFRASRRKNLKVPQDVSLLVAAANPVHIEDLEIASLGLSKERFGAVVCDALIDRIESKVPTPINRSLKLEFREGRSLAAPSPK